MISNRIELLRTLRAYSWDQEGWFPPLKNALQDLTAAQASWQPPGGGNTIWQTVNHLNYYNEMILARITGAPFEATAPDNTSTFGEPGNPEDTAGWLSTLAKTHQIAEGLEKALAELTEADLDRPLRNSTVGEALTSWMMHEAHHTGQIVLIRKMQGSWPAQREM
jgi:uncharacterized damage-inducible protein DinB